MSFRIAFGVTIAAVTFAIVSAVGGKLSYEAALTGLLAVLTYWSQAPSMNHRQSEQIEGSGDVENL